MVSLFSLLVSQCPHQSKLEHSSQTLDNTISLSITPNPEDCPQCAACREEDGALEEADREGNHLEERTEDDTEDEEEEEEEEEGGNTKKKKKKKRKKKRSCFGSCKDLWDEMRVKLRSIVESKYFNRGIMIAILINTISMGIEHHNQVKRWLSYPNAGFKAGWNTEI